MNALEITPNQTQVCVYRPSALDERDRLILESADIEKVDDQFSMAEAVDVCRRLRKMLADVEKTRKLVKEQPLELCRAIDAKAKEFVGPISTELDRLSGAAGAYQREQERIAAEAERKQREEAQRLQREAEEAERRRQEEAQRLARAAREAQEAEQTAFNEAEKNAAT
jgi:hypothetical protein